MSILAWIVVGLVAGWLARYVMPGREPGGMGITLVLGVVGAIVGGFIARSLGYSDPTGINLYSIIIAFLGAVVVILIWNAVSGRRTTA